MKPVYFVLGIDIAQRFVGVLAVNPDREAALRDCEGRYNEDGMNIDPATVQAFNLMQDINIVRRKMLDWLAMNDIVGVEAKEVVQSFANAILEMLEDGARQKGFAPKASA